MAASGPSRVERIGAWILFLLLLASIAFIWVLPSRNAAGQEPLRIDYRSPTQRVEGSSR